MSAQLSEFARSLSVETAFTVLAWRASLKAEGKDVIELQIGDSPFDSTAAAKAGRHRGHQRATSRTTARRPACPSSARPRPQFVREEFGIPAERGERRRRARAPRSSSSSSARRSSNPGDGVLVFSPHFPTYVPNIERRGARAVLAPLQQENEFRPDLDDIERFLADGPVAEGDLPQLAAQPDRRRGDARRT